MKDIPWYEWLYAVTEDGKFWSYPKKWASWNNAKGEHLWKFIKPWINSSWYMTVVLTKDKKQKSFQAHRLYARLYLPNPENKPQINHINWIKTDNRIENLEWCTARENILHSLYITKTNKPICLCDYNVKKRIKVGKFDEKGELIEIFNSTCEAARITNLFQSSIYRCIIWIYKTCWWFVWKRVY